MSTDPQRADDLFRQALQFKPDERTAFLAGACGTDARLRQRVEDLLAAHEEETGVLTVHTSHDGAQSNLEEVILTEGPDSLISHYKLLEKLGEGGFGVVWAAEQKEPVRRRVALKIIKLGMDTRQVVARFEAERQALALMDHPNIAKVLDAGATDTGRPYFVMELVRGIPITEYCTDKKLGTKERLDLFIKVCRAIQHAHQKGIIHRDIKPSNIMVTLHDGVPVPKVIDFGIAKATQQELTEKTVYTKFNQFIGTPAYMSPEQAEMSGLDIDTRSDIYSLGVLLYELLTGSTPFDTEELMRSGLDEMRKIIREREPMRPSTKLSQTLETATSPAKAPRPSPLASDLDWIVMKCLEKDRSRRYDTANGLAMDLQRHLNHEPVIARPPSSLYKFQKAFRRNKLAFTSVMLIGMTVMIALAVSSWSFVRERQARVEEEAQRREADHMRSVAQTNAQIAIEQKQVAEANANHARLNLYAADMNLAHDAIKAGNIGRAARLLDRHRPHAGEEDLRNWEWRYLWQLVQGDELFALPPFDHHVFSIDHSPDGRHLAIALYDGRILIWDLRRNAQVAILTEDARGTNMALSTAKCVYSTDGAMLFGFCRMNEGIRRWNTQSLEELPQLEFRQPSRFGTVRNITLSRDGRYIAAYGASTSDGDRAEIVIAVWDTQTGDLLAQWNHPGTRVVTHMGAVCFSADASKVFAGGNDGRIVCYDRATGAVDTNWMAHDGQSITAMALSPDGTLLASGAGWASGDIGLWDADTGDLVATLTGHGSWVSWLEFSEDGTVLASASADQTARLWDVATRTTQSVLQGHGDELYTLSLSPDGDTLATGSKDGTLFVWSMRPEQKQASYMNRTMSSSFHVSPDAEHLFVHANGGTTLELDPTDLSDIGPVDEFAGHNNFMFSPDSRSAIVIREDEGTYVYDLESKQPERFLEGVIARELARGIGYLASELTNSDEFAWYDVSTWELVGTTPPSTTERVRRGVLSYDGRYYAFEPLRQTGLISVIEHNVLEGTGVPVARFEAHRRAVNGMAFSPDGTLLATTSATGFGYLWNTRDWTREATLRGHALGIHDVAFSPDSRRVMTGGSGDDALKLWDTSSHQEVMTLPVDGSVFTDPILLEDDRTLMAKSWDNDRPRLHVWRAPTWEEIAVEEARKGRRGRLQ